MLPLSLEQCLEGIKESEPIAVKQFITGSSKYTIGKFNSDAFFDACAGNLHGGHLHIAQKEATVRFLEG